MGVIFYEKQAMKTETFRKTPFLFLRYLFVIEFFFAFLPLIAAILFPLQEEYNQTALARELPYNLLFVLILTTLQVLIVAISFYAWYLPLFRINRKGIAYKRAGAVEFKELIPTRSIQRIRIRQGWFGRRLDFGSLQIIDASSGQTMILKDIPNPVGIAKQIEKWIDKDSRHKQLPDVKSAIKLIEEGESQYVEFKSSILWDYYQEKMNKGLSIPIMKNVAGFLNTAGGTLLVGIDDDGNVLGLDADFAVMKKPNPDGFELIFNNAFSNMIGPEFRHFVQLSFPEIEGKSICLIAVQPSTNPVYFRHQGKEDFYIRAGNASQPLSVSKATAYMKERFQS
jgi:membrane protein YdbS with pleckstrin-like domain